MPLKTKCSVASYALGIQELVDYIIDHLSDSPYDLLSCALVAKSWIYCAQRHIYHHLDLTPDDSGCDEAEIKVHRLMHTLQKAPYLVPLIRAVSVPLNSPALTDLACVPFTRLTEFRLECTSYPWAAPAHAEVIPPLQAILRLPSLRRVVLWGYLEPISIIDELFDGCSPNIQHLRLALDNLDSYPGEQRIFNDPPCVSRPKIALAHLSVPRELEGWMRGPRCPFSFAHLRSLEIRASDWVVLKDIFAPSLPQLESLSLTPLGRDWGVELRALPALVELNVCIEDFDGLRGLTALLAALPSKNRLLRLSITLPGDPMPHERAFREFDTRVAECEMLSFLQGVKINFQSQPGSLENSVRSYLPRLATKARLSISSGYLLCSDPL
ncbi:hypothetical protein C8R44DRAFT_979329 [Mycena epipterygia]|nr:hypothetical protein C8R44DRAFT_979329 [Mycena epipterygia]